MTTRPMPRRTMLPPNLTRHLYETRRLIAEGEGRELPPWYRLTPEERAAAEMDMEVFRRAILRAEEEQDLVATYNAAAAERPAAGPTAENCSCPGCSLAAAILGLLEQSRRLEAVLGWDVGSDGQGASVFGVKPAPLSAEERDRLKEAARQAVEEWVAAGKPLELVTDPAPAGNVFWTFDVTPSWLTPADLDDSAQRRFDRLSRDFWNARLRPFPPKV